MGFHINDKNITTKAGKKAKTNQANGKGNAGGASKPAAGGGKKMMKTGGTRGS